MTLDDGQETVPIATLAKSACTLEKTHSLKRCTDLFEAFPLCRNAGLFIRVFSTFGQKPVALRGVVADYYTGRGDVKDGDAGANSEMFAVKAGDDRVI